MRIWLVVIMAVLLSQTLRGQVIFGGDSLQTSFEKSVYGLGFSGGPVSGFGASFRVHSPGHSSFQINLGLMKTSETTFFSTGGTFQYDVVRGTLTRFFIGASTSYFYYGDGRNRYQAPWRFGVGLGGEFNAVDALHFAFEGAFVYFSNGDILPMPQLSLHYYFLTP